MITKYDELKTAIRSYMVILCMIMFISCTPKSESTVRNEKEKREVVTKRRKDGTRSSVNQIDEERRVHGFRWTFYKDGTTVYSKLNVIHGKKHGPAVWYYKNGTISYQTTYKDGKKHGMVRKYYENGKLMAEFQYDEGTLLPGLKEYNREGVLIDDYPEILFREENHLRERGRVDLIFYSSKKYQKIKYYIQSDSYGQTGLVYLISEDGSAKTKFYIKPGESLEKKVEITAEIRTDLGNILVRELSYDLKIRNTL